MTFCSHCGAKLNDGSKFCPNCGSRVAEKIDDSGKETLGNIFATFTSEQKRIADILIQQAITDAQNGREDNPQNNLSEDERREFTAIFNTFSEKQKNALYTVIGIEIDKHKKPNNSNFQAKPSDANRNASESQHESDAKKRKQEFAGKIIKCPACGEDIPSYTAICPACGHELRGVGVSESVHEFALRLEKANSIESRIFLIRNFPIPNTKEDIVEFMILASTNVKGEANSALLDAWLAKLEQSYQKAKLILKDEKDIAVIQSLYDDAHVQINKQRNIRIAKQTGKAATSFFGIALSHAVCNLGTCCGIIVLIISVILDNSGGESELAELIGCILLIASACVLNKKDSRLIDFGICAASGGLAFFLAELLLNGSLLQLTGGIVLIIVAVNYFKSISKSNPSAPTETVRYPSTSEENAYVLKAKLEQKGFTNIRMVNLKDIVLGLVAKPGKIESVTINGKEPWAHKSYAPDAQIIITYHGRPQEQ